MTDACLGLEAGIDTLRTYVQTSSVPLISRGLEKEGLRTLANSDISQSDHPKALGHPLTHSSITTDYSEALLELITGVESNAGNLLSQLEMTHRFVLNNIGDELLWAGSMPCHLDGDKSIRIAEYGDSNIGRLKHIYRKGLDVRYGRIMQSIAGLHFNFSLSDEFWMQLKDAENSQTDLQTYKSEKYFALTRNFRRYSWLLMYLFGASPALDASFLNGKSSDLEVFDEKGTYYKPYATSLRMSDLGYTNNAQSSLNICFNTLDNFTKTLGDAIHTSYPSYEKIGLKDDHDYTQLNTNILQIENEYYSSIRPKRTTFSGEKPTAALIERGVEYVEVRCLDLNPYLPLGIDKQQVTFMDGFLLFCLLQDSPFLSAEACEELERNFTLVTNEGRKPNLSLNQNDQARDLKEWATSLLANIEQVSSALNKQDAAALKSAIKAQQAKVKDSALCPSAKVLADMQSKSASWLELCTALSSEHKSQLLASSINEQKLSELESTAKQSHQDAQNIKQADNVPFDAFLDAYVSP
ncbi:MULTISPECIES: glutamate--cysteine ligase [unclassified Oleiphilus]|uniref:glutamate--cysteine ligase n=1 Tax=unclassified Oleiphilus TaxID=2631174 RepID=UPI0007C21B0C|nr:MULTISPECIES: glutamate--cysteine ligase [unclassified Oleiphilus]KZY64885.1 hypothetical protein A3738_09870 [Oleiphilus sp. HI0066]KZY71478.1 hypothetical protein A3739_04565 [Oleiphilus sp. HI0067]